MVLMQTLVWSQNPMHASGIRKHYNIKYTSKYMSDISPCLFHLFFTARHRALNSSVAAEQQDKELVVDILSCTTLTEQSSGRLWAYYSHFANIEPISTFHLQHLHSTYCYSMWAALAGSREVLLSPRHHFHVSFVVMAGVSVLKMMWGHSAQLHSSLADSFSYLLSASFRWYKAVLLAPDSFLSWKIPFVCSGETPPGLLWLTPQREDMDLFEQVQRRAV